MISKLVKGAGFKGCAKYISQKDGAQEICSNNLFTDSPETRAGEMRAVAESAVTKKPVFHASLSLDSGQKATDEQWKIASEAYLEKMGFDIEKTQYFVNRHSDASHDHVHILANRVMLDGKVLSDKKDFIRSHEATRHAEKAANLPAFDKNAEKSTDGKMSNLKLTIASALSNSNGDLDKFKSDLKKQDIELKITRNEDGRATGALFNREGKTWAGSQIDCQFSIGNLQKQGLKIENPHQQNHSHNHKIDHHCDGDSVSHLTTSSGGGSIGIGGGGEDGEKRNRTENFLRNVSRQQRQSERGR